MPQNDREGKSKTSHARVEATSAMTDSAHLMPQSQISGSSHVNAIRVEWAHEGSWIFALEDQHTRRKSKFGRKLGFDDYEQDRKQDAGCF